jgi:hypothetical protein
MINTEASSISSLFLSTCGRRAAKNVQITGTIHTFDKAAHQGTCVYGTNVLENRLIDGRRAIRNAVSACNLYDADFFLSSTKQITLSVHTVMNPLSGNLSSTRFPGFAIFWILGPLAKKKKVNSTIVNIYSHLLHLICARS